MSPDDVTRVQRGLSHYRGQQCAFAYAVASNHADALARRERQIDILNHHRLAVTGGNLP